MVATLPPLLRCMLFRLSPSSTQPFGSLYIRKREKGKKEKRDINSIVFAQRCPVFLPLTPVFDSPVFPFSQTSSPVYLLATHDGVDTIVRCRIRRGVGLMYTNRLGGRWNGRSLSRLSYCLCLHLRWHWNWVAGSMCNGCWCHCCCSGHILWRCTGISAGPSTGASDISVSFVERIHVHWSTELLPSVGRRLVAFRSPSPSLRITVFSLLNLPPDPAHRTSSLPFTVGEDTGIVRSAVLGWSLGGRVGCVGCRTSKRYRLLEAASGLRR
jgi:hypothetical protein